MREAVVVVGAAILGVGVVLLSYPPAAPPPPEPRREAPRGELAPRDAGAIAADDCPCGTGPLEPAGWEATLDGPTVDGATALSLALPDAEALRGALRAEDPAMRELAALLLNVTSGRVAGCAPLAEGNGRVAAVLDRLDRLAADVEAGRPVPAADLATAAAAAGALNRGEGLPPACGR